MMALKGFYLFYLWNKKNTGESENNQKHKLKNVLSITKLSSPQALLALFVFVFFFGLKNSG